MDHDELTLLALSRYTAAAPRVSLDFTRRGADLRDLAVELTDQDHVVVRFRRGTTPHRLSLPLWVPDDECAVLALAELLQGKEIEEGDNTWPGCLPGHPHPPEPALAGGRAHWACPRTGEPISPIS